MKKNLLFLLLAILLPGLASAGNMAVNFTGGTNGTTGDWVTVPYSAINPTSEPYTGSYTVGAWMRVSELNSAGVAMGYGTTSNANDNGAFHVVVRSSGIALSNCWGIRNCTGMNGVTSTQVMPLNEWHFIAYTVDNTNLKLKVYYDGTPIIEQDMITSAPLFTTADGENDGAFQLGTYGFLGDIDDFAIYNKALTAMDITSAMENPADVDGLTAHYTFDEVIEGTTGQFANKAQSEYSSVVATYQKLNAINNWENGLASVYSATESTPTLVEGREISEPAPAGLTYRRKYTDGSSRYYSEISYDVFGENTVVYQTADPTTESYYVTPLQNQWQEEGAYVDFKDKVIEVPADAGNFTMVLKGASAKWSQSCVFVDWNKNGSFIDEGETNGVINLGVKPNETGGGLVATTGDKDVITLPAGLQEGDTFSMLICLNEPKGVDGTGDKWGDHWEWSTEIFNENVCSVINGQAYELTVKITAPTPETYSFQVPYTEQFENITNTIFLDGGGRVMTPGSTVTGIVAGTEFRCAISVAQGYNLTEVKVGETVAELTLMSSSTNQWMAAYTINGNITADMVTMTTEKVPQKYAVTITQPENGTITVKNGETAVNSGDEVAAGTVLTLSCEAADGYELAQYTLDGQPVEGNTITMPEAACTISADMAAIDLYCVPEGTTSNPNGKGVSSLTVNGTTITGPGTSTYRPIYSDQTATVINVKPGEDISVSVSGAGSWMHTFFYIDYDQNGWTVDTEGHTPNGDLVWYQQLAPESKLTGPGVPTDYYTMDGTLENEKEFNINGVTFTVSVPADLAPGDYRARYKSDWASSNPCGNPHAEQTISGNAATFIDFTIHVEEPAPTVVSTKEYVGKLTIDMMGETQVQDGVSVYFDTMSDDTYTLRLENFGASETAPTGMGDITVSGITREGDNLTGHADEIILAGGDIVASADLTGVIEGEDITLNLDVIWKADVGDVHIPVVFTTKQDEPTGLSYRRKYTDDSKRYYTEISYNVLGSDKTAYQTADPTAEPYYVTPVNGEWKEEGAYIDLKDKVIEIPANAENFTMILKGDPATAVKWSQSCVYVDWNNNGSFIDEGETNGVINRDIKPNTAGGGLVATEDGERDNITLPTGLKEGDTFPMLICLTEPKGVDGNQDLWGASWEWSTEIFNNNVCSLINGQAYELTVKIIAADYSAISGIGVDGNDAPVEYYNLQGIRVNADQLVPGIYVVRQGNKTAKVLVK